MAQCLFIVRVPEVEPYVAPLRECFDPAARRGLGAHVTLLHASVPPGGIDQVAIGRVAVAASSLAPFAFQIAGVARFPGTLYLAVEPAARFVCLHEKLLAALPALAPDAQRRQPLVPHVSIVRGSASDERDVETELVRILGRHGPIACRCGEIALLESSSGMWRPVREFPLSGGTGSPSPKPS